MFSDNNDSLTSTRIKTVTVKKRTSSGDKPASAKASADKPAAKSKKEPAVKRPKRTKLSVRLLSGDVKNEEEVLASKEQGGETVVSMVGSEAKTKKIKKKAKGEPLPEDEKEEEKDFFQKINRQIEEEDNDNDKKKEEEERPRPVGFYRKISFFFILLTLLLVGAAFYFFFMSLTVEVTPKKERISDKTEMTVTAKQQEEGVNLSGKKYVNGLVERISVKEEKKYDATGADILGQEILGKVFIINNYTQSKTLIATTRLLSPEGKLFRIKDKVDIPAGGSAEVEIYTDEPSEEMAIGPTEFTIPGLWAGLQDKIYAKSDEAFVYQTQVRKFVQAIDLEKATQDLKEVLVKRINEQFSGNYKGFDKVIAEIDKNSLEASSTAESGDKVDDFISAINVFVNIIAFNEADAEKLAQEKLLSSISNDKSMGELEQQNMKYSLVSSDFDDSQAVVEVSFVGTATLSNTDNIVDKKKLVGLNEAQIKNYLRGLDRFSDFKLIFRPSFIKKAPVLVDRIKIVIK